jgi:hypothetical protein
MKALITLALEAYLTAHSLKAIMILDKEQFKPPVLNEWIENSRVPTVLNISRRKLQYLRDKGELPFSKCSGKIYYKVYDLNKLIESNYKSKKKRDIQ